jgi:oxygen-independent coproporphyrinogen-3 oxidase
MGIKGEGKTDSLRRGVSRFSDASLYLHIPFCAGACDYCDFYSIPVKPGDPRLDGFVDVLAADGERQIRRFALERIPTVYIGGGTPSLLGAAGIERLLRRLASLWKSGIGPPAEITVEANPESSDGDFLHACREAGVTRLSLGVQTFHRESRLAVHRPGWELLPERLALVSENFGAAFSADLIAGLPFQDETILLRDIEKLLAYKPAHVSLYALTMEPGSALEKKRALSGLRGDDAFPSQDEIDRLWILGAGALEQAGYPQYEVSNFAPPGKRSLHNIRYWRMENWLGIGPAASGTLIDDEEGRGLRYTWPADAEAYMRGALEPAGEFLDSLTLLKETLLMGFRYIEGPDEVLFVRRFKRGIEDCIPRTLAKWREGAFVQTGKTALTGKGLLFLNSFLMDCFEELNAGAEK